MTIGQRPNRKGDKIYFFYDNGTRDKGNRSATNVWIWAHPKNQEQKNFNKEALKILEVKQGQAVIERQAIGTPVIPTHKFKANFFDYFEEYIKLNKRDGNRHLTCCLSKLRLFVESSYLAPVNVTENFCKRFRRYLLDNLTGETPANYFARFKWVVDAARRDGYFRDSPSENIAAVGNPSVALKEVLEVEDYVALLRTPYQNQQVKLAFLFSCYTGLRWIDVKLMKWKEIADGVLTTRIIQRKTGRPVLITLHQIALAILEQARKLVTGKVDLNTTVFDLPTANGANDDLKEWVKIAGIKRHITWSCARLSFSILLQDQRVDDATVAYLMGHATTKQVQSNYKRHRPKNQEAVIAMLPSPTMINLV
jgi:integrase